jgi:hypothetical protein
MNVGLVILLIIVILVVLGGVAVGLYFLLRKTTPPGNNPAPPNPPGNNPNPPNPPGNHPTPPPGNKGPIPPNIVPGIFSINSVKDPALFLTIGNNSDPNSQGNPPLIASSNTSIVCANYAWQNIYNYNSSPTTNANVPSALVSNITSLTEGGITQSTPPFFLITNFFGSDPSVIISASSVASIGQGQNEDVTWNYNTSNKTWCGPSTGSFANTCLYLENDNTISSKTFDSSDMGFQWNNVPTIKSPNCLT